LAGWIPYNGSERLLQRTLIKNQEFEVMVVSYRFKGVLSRGATLFLALLAMRYDSGKDSPDIPAQGGL